MPDIAIRPARDADAEQIAAIYNEAVATTTATFDTALESDEHRRTWLAEHDAPQLPVLVAHQDDVVVGWAALSRYSERCAYSSTVEVSTYVAAGQARRGIGMRLTEAVLEAGAAAGAHAVIARICTENVGSLAMAERLGFEQVGVMREVGRKFERWLDVAILERMT